MTSMSYFAVIQYLAAAQQPPHLNAIFPYLGFTDLYRHFVYHGGTFQSDFFATYYRFVGSTQKVAVKPALRQRPVESNLGAVAHHAHLLFEPHKNARTPAPARILGSWLCHAGL